MDHRFIYGKNPRQNVVSIEVDGNELVVFQEKDGAVTSERLPHHPWLMSDKPHGDWAELDGNLHYKYLKVYESDYAMHQDRRRLSRADIFQTYDQKEAEMQLRGITYYKGMKPKDVSVLSFDLETTGVVLDDTSEVLLISNTFRRGDSVVRKLFAYDEYETPAAMFQAWCAWVCEMDPSIILGHHIYGYDLPYIDFCANRSGATLNLGRDGTPLWIDYGYKSKFRKGDGQFLEFNKAHIFGREIVDTMFLSIRYDTVPKKYENFKLKNIIAQEGLERIDRVFYDASLIRTNYLIPEEWEKIKAYAEHDADDALALYDLMVPAYFYLTQSVPKPFQGMMVSASGGQINSFLVRSYLQNLHSLPKASEPEPYEGAISLGNPGVYKNVFKADIASLYPSIMLEYKVYDQVKDPEGHFLRMVEHFTAERLANKKLAKETGEQHYKDLSEAQKIIINSAYGMLAAPGLGFNSPRQAAIVTEKGRDILKRAMEWAEKNNLPLANADTDSISIAAGFTWSVPEWRAQEKKWALDSLNALSPSNIRWEDDGVFSRVLILKAKNYVLDDGKKIKIKGSALKASLKEKALKEFIGQVVQQLLEGSTDLSPLYKRYALEILTLTDITRWASKVSLTEAVASSARTREEKIREAIKGSDLRQGDKFYVYPTSDDRLKLQEHWSGDHDAATLLGKLYDTSQIFSTVTDLSGCLNYTLKRNKAALQSLT